MVAQCGRDVPHGMQGPSGIITPCPASGRGASTHQRQIGSSSRRAVSFANSSSNGVLYLFRPLEPSPSTRPHEPASSLWTSVTSFQPTNGAMIKSRPPGPRVDEIES